MALFDSYLELSKSRKRTSRRMFMIGGTGFLGGYAVFRWWRFRARAVANRITRYVTSNKDFYSVSLYDGFSPNTNVAEWKLELVDLQGTVSTLSYTELRALKSLKVLKTLVCVGNEIGGPLMGNAEWTVTPLAPIIRRLLESSDGDRVMFYGLDGFYSSVSVEAALDEHSYIAYEMNGEPLPDIHGYPARVFFPGRYGMKQPRWLRRIEIVRSPIFKGYWESRGFGDSGRIHPQARIDYAMRGKEADWLVTGTATAAEKKVGSVEVSFDDGETWRSAKLTCEPRADSWCTWSVLWLPASKGEYIIAARVTAEGGERQVESNGTAFPSGSTGLHRVKVMV